MKLPSRFLVAIDDGPDADVIAKAAAELARKAGPDSELHVLHVVEPLVPEGPGGVVSTEALLEAGARVVGDAAAVAARTFGGRIVTHVRLGFVTAEIIAAAGELAIDLVVVGTTDKGLLARTFLGSVASQVVRKAPCPVLVTRPKAPTEHQMDPAPAAQLA